MAVHVARPEGRKWRDMYCRTLASQLSADAHKNVQAFVIRQLQVAGTDAVAEQLGAQLLDKDLCEYATQALLAIHAGAANQLRGALPEAEGPVLLTVVRALGVLRDQESAESLRQLTDHDDPQIQLAAITALAHIGDPASVDVLLRKADEATGFDRIAATDACLVLAERLLEEDLPNEAKKIYAYLRDTRQNTSDGHVVSAAEKGIARIN
jgi:HEAT repeat protein